MRLIDADALFEDCMSQLNRLDINAHEFENCYPYWIFHEAITEAPTIEAEPVRHGKWTHEYYPTVWYGPGDPPEWVCSVCKDRAYNTYDYCPNCGAKMDVRSK